ncbi:MAG: Ycf66 family protein [Cyanobacteria bacterium P01_F01_bin.42]
MLTLLVWTVALGSLSIFLAGVIFPELSRKNDLIWVGTGLFYALVLWANRGNIGLGLAFGQTAGVSMMVWLGWQAMTQRRELTAPDKKTPVPEWLQNLVDALTQLWAKVSAAIANQLDLEDSSGEGESPSLITAVKAKFASLLEKRNDSENVSQDFESADDADFDTDAGLSSDADEVEAPDSAEDSPVADGADEKLESAEASDPDAENETESDSQAVMGTQEPTPPEAAQPEVTPPEVTPPETIQTAAETIDVEKTIDTTETIEDSAVETNVSDASVTDTPDVTETVTADTESSSDVDVAPEVVSSSVPEEDAVPEVDAEAPKPQAEVSPEDAPPQEESNWPPEPMS